MRKIIAALQVSVDGFIEGPNKEIDWIESWEDPFGLLPQIDECVLGGGMYPGYESYWTAVMTKPDEPLPFSGRLPSQGELDYARFASATPHTVLSRTFDNPLWKSTRIVRTIEEIRTLKQRPGKDIHAVGGATFVSSLFNAGLVDELRLVVHPIILGGGTALFKDVNSRHRLQLLESTKLGRGQVRLTYGMQA